MSATVPVPVPVPYADAYGPMVGRGEVEAHVLETLSVWMVTYIAAYERKYGLIPRSTPTPPTPESVHGGLDSDTWESNLSPELIVVVQPTGSVERYPEEGYGQWFEVQVHAIVQVEGDQDRARRLADVYGTALQALLTEQGAFGVALNGTDPFATRTRLVDAAAASFQDENVRDIVRETVGIHTFVIGLANDLDGPRVPPADPYALPLPWPPANKVEITLVGEEPDGTPSSETNSVLIDGTYVPTRITYE